MSFGVNFWNYLNKPHKEKKVYTLTWILLNFGFYLLPFIILFWAFWMRTYGDEELYRRVFSEDEIVEFSQFLILFISGLSSLVYILFNRTKFDKFVSFFLILISLGLLFVAGEEVSWGQRKFEWESHELVETHNSQNETTLHNLNIFQTLLDTGFANISALFFILSLVLYDENSWLSNSRYYKYLKYIVPSPKYTSYFLISFLLLIAYTFVRDYLVNFIDYRHLDKSMMDKSETELAETIVYFAFCLNYWERLSKNN